MHTFWIDDMGIFDSLLGGKANKFIIKRKDSDAGEAGNLFQLLYDHIFSFTI